MADLVSQLVENSISGRLAEQRARRGGIAAIETLSAAVRGEYPIETVERLEAALKAALGSVFAAGPDLLAAVAVATAQRDLGYLLKYKPYAVKCAHPLGYSVFLQRPGEGFSFQRHETHKLEVFHILEVQARACVFLCDYPTWQRIYEPERFSAWLAGERNPAFDCLSYVPCPGDVLVIDELNVVHAILGCVLEEFATASTDIVDRLHDQNSRLDIPTEFSRTYAALRLERATYPAASRRVDPMSQPGRDQPIQEAAVRGGSVRTFVDSFVRAAHYTMHSAGAWLQDPSRAAALSIKSGSGTVALRVGGQVASDLVVEAGDVTTIPPGVDYRIIPHDDRLSYSEHLIDASIAFKPPPDSCDED